MEGKIKTNLRLRVVYDTRDEENGIYAEFDENEFKKILLAEYEKVHNVSRAFERTCERLRKLTGTL